VLAVLLWFDFTWNFGYPGVWLLPVLVFFAAAGANEMLGMVETSPARPSAWVVYLISILATLGGAVPLIMALLGKPYPPDCPIGRMGFPMLALAIGVIVAFGEEIRTFKKAGGVVARVGMAVFASAYIGGLLSFFGALRLFPIDGEVNNGWGLAALLSMAFITKFGDIGAYTFGRLFGKHKLAPRLSPGKTIEGAIGGVITGCVAAWVFLTYLTPALTDGQSAGSWWSFLIYGLIVTTTGMLGDLAESLIKRDMKKKDSSTWLPGLGGVLDILDSLLFAAPVAYLCWVLGLIGPL